jgi:hypothetical protein
MNSIVYAEYLRRKQSVTGEPALDAEGINQELDHFIKAFHYAWLSMEQLNIIDDSETGPLGRVSRDLGRSKLAVQLIVRLLWWWTTPEATRPEIPWRDFALVAREAVERLGLRGVLHVLRQGLAKQSVVEAILSAYAMT